MLEYKREKINLESRVQELEKNSTDHDDHIRIVDAWVLQVRRNILNRPTQTTLTTPSSYKKSSCLLRAQYHLPAQQI